MNLTYKSIVRCSTKIKPISLEEACKHVNHYCEMSNKMIMRLAILGDQDAKEERLIREIMTVDNVDWKTAQHRFSEMLLENRKHNWLINLPYNVGIISFFGAGVLAFPMVFDYNTVNWFNEAFVTGEVPEE